MAPESPRASMQLHMNFTVHFRAQGLGPRVSYTEERLWLEAFELRSSVLQPKLVATSVGHHANTFRLFPSSPPLVLFARVKVAAVAVQATLSVVCVHRSAVLIPSHTIIQPLDTTPCSLETRWQQAAPVGRNFFVTVWLTRLPMHLPTDGCPEAVWAVTSNFQRTVCCRRQGAVGLGCVFSEFFSLDSFSPPPSTSNNAT